MTALSPKTEFQKNLSHILDLKRQGYAQADIWRTLKAEGKFHGSQPVFYYHFQRIDSKQFDRPEAVTTNPDLTPPTVAEQTPKEKTTAAPKPTQQAEAEPKVAPNQEAEVDTEEEELDLSQPLFALNDLPRFDSK